MRLKRSFTIKQFQGDLTTKTEYIHMVFLSVFSKKFANKIMLNRVLLLLFKVWHQTPWSYGRLVSSLVAFVREETGLKVSNKNMCVCDTCRLSIRHAMKAKANNESYQLRWFNGKGVFSLPPLSMLL